MDFVCNYPKKFFYGQKFLLVFPKGVSESFWTYCSLIHYSAKCVTENGVSSNPLESQFDG